MHEAPQADAVLWRQLSNSPVFAAFSEYACRSQSPSKSASAELWRFKRCGKQTGLRTSNRGCTFCNDCSRFPNRNRCTEVANTVNAPRRAARPSPSGGRFLRVETRRVLPIDGLRDFPSGAGRCDGQRCLLLNPLNNRFKHLLFRRHKVSCCV